MSIIHPGYAVGGSDISYYQTPINYNLFYSKMDFVIHRIADSIKIPNYDTSFDNDYRESKSRRVPRGIYLFHRPGIDARTQVDFVLQHPAMKTDYPELGFYLDLEEKNPQRTVGPKKVPMYKSDVTQSVLSFIDLFELQTGKVVNFYTSAGWWNQYIDHTKIPRLSQRVLWAASWPFGNIREKPVSIPAGWPRWDLWQFSCTGSMPYGQPGDGKSFGVHSRGLDLNVWRGSRQEFETFFRCKLLPVIPGDTNKIPVKYVIGSSTVAIRSQPSITGSILFYAPNNATLPVMEVAQDNQGRDWYKIGGNKQFSMWVAAWLGKTFFE